MSISDNAKEIADIVKDLGDMELYRKIIELEAEILELTRGTHALEKNIEDLNHVLELKENMKFREPFYYQETDPAPFCPNCWEKNKLAIHVFNSGLRGSSRTTYFDCKSCASKFTIANFR
ncbi:MAG: hypothetical protein COA96_14100 [SAR86 cluster bacterium]|uniref:Uncharacterized protein n=1 Tax=SAR86 cluster bacterium TaxID=2030880 RepID=A0A2A5AUQ7_9GAMM|nr:MAG: hypothetical protein COA96_14100 [SAR86 cluster bacterium]